MSDPLACGVPPLSSLPLDIVACDLGFGPAGLCSADSPPLHPRPAWKIREQPMSGNASLGSFWTTGALRMISRSRCSSTTSAMVTRARRLTVFCHIVQFNFLVKPALVEWILHVEPKPRRLSLLFNLGSKEKCPVEPARFCERWHVQRGVLLFPLCYAEL